MATWRPIGSLTPDHNRRFIWEQSHFNFYRLLIANCPQATDYHLILEAWANQKPLGQLIRPILPEQVFEWLAPCDRMISIKLGRPIRSVEPPPVIEVGLSEWQIDPPRPDPELNLWLPGNR